MKPLEFNLWSVVMHNSHRIDLSRFSGLLYSEVDLLDKHSDKMGLSQLMPPE